MTPRTLRILYWVFTLIFVLPQTWSAVQMLSEAPRMTQTIVGLGYPIYVMKILGVAKLAGAAAILFGRFPRLKEWAYAGFTFDVIGAFFSHVGSGDPIYVAAVPLIFLVAQLLSYFTWKRLEDEPKVDGESTVRRPSGAAAV
jgi:hypothetical protein